MLAIDARRLFIASSLIGVLSGTPQLAHATLTVNAQAWASTNFTGIPTYDSTYSYTDSSLTAFATQSSSLSTATAYAMASYGRLGLSTYSTAKSDSTNGSVGNAGAIARWDDTIRIGSSSLAVGTLVTINGQLTLHDITYNNTITSPWYPSAKTESNNQDPVSIRYFLNILNLSVYGSSFAWALLDDMNYGLGGGEHTQTLTFSFDAHVGDKLLVINSLDGAAVSEAVQALTSQSAGLDATHTGLFGFFDNNPDISVLADSGTNYAISQAVPEPNGLSLVLAGLILLTCWSMRQRS